MSRNAALNPKSLCEEFARLKGYGLRLCGVSGSAYHYGRLWYVRIRYGKYSLKYFDGARMRTQEKAWEALAEQLCDPDRWFNPHNFKGWSHFGKCSSFEELALKMTVAGGMK